MKDIPIIKDELSCCTQRICILAYEMFLSMNICVLFKHLQNDKIPFEKLFSYLEEMYIVLVSNTGRVMRHFTVTLKHWYLVALK